MNSYDFFIYEFKCFMNSIYEFRCTKVPDVGTSCQRDSKACQWMQNLQVKHHCVVWADLSVCGLDPTRFKLPCSGPGRSGLRCRTEWGGSPDSESDRSPESPWPLPGGRLEAEVSQAGPIYYGCGRDSRHDHRVTLPASSPVGPEPRAGPGTLLTWINF